MKWYIVLQGGVSMIIKDELEYEPTTKEIEYSQKHYSEYYGFPMTVTNVYSVKVA